MLAWGKLESWAGAGKLSAMAELSAMARDRPRGRHPRRNPHLVEQILLR